MTKLNDELIYWGVGQVEFKVVVFEYSVAGGTSEIFTLPIYPLIWTFNPNSIVTSTVVKFTIMFRKI